MTRPTAGTARPSSPREIADRVRSGDVRTAARLMRDIDDSLPEAAEVLKLLHAYAGRAYVIGVTGPPGAGKSTLTDALIRAYREQGLSVGVAAVDPTSPFSGGALLGDRIRMGRHAADKGVFIRSLATRGQFGGLTASTRGVVSVLAAMGFEIIIIETVGVGQDEVDVAGSADTTLVLSVPGLGDEIQAVKAGILEVGDVFVINKMDRPGADETAAQIEGMLDLQCDSERREGWRPPVVMTCAVEGRGVEDLVEAVAAHRRSLEADDGRIRKLRRRERARKELVEIVKDRILRRLENLLEADDLLDRLAGEIARAETDPYTESQKLLERIEFRQ